MKFSYNILFFIVLFLSGNARSQSTTNPFSEFDEILQKSDFLVEGILLDNIREENEVLSNENQNLYRIAVTRSFFNKRNDFKPLVCFYDKDTISVEIILDKNYINTNDSLRNGRGRSFIFLIKQNKHDFQQPVLRLTGFNSVYSESINTLINHIITDFFVATIQNEYNKLLRIIRSDTYSIPKHAALEIAKQKKRFYKEKNGWKVTIKPDGDKKQWVVSSYKYYGKHKIESRNRSVYIDAETGEIVSTKKYSKKNKYIYTDKRKNKYPAF